MYGNPGSRQDLCSLPLEEYDRVILLTRSGGEETSVNKLDVPTTTTAMYIRHAQVRLFTLRLVLVKTCGKLLQKILA